MRGKGGTGRGGGKRGGVGWGGASISDCGGKDGLLQERVRREVEWVLLGEAAGVGRPCLAWAEGSRKKLGQGTGWG